jgi:hypothetical protein
MTFYDLDGRETDKNDKTGSDVNGQQNEVSHVPKDEIWKYGEFGAIGQGDNKNFLLSKNGNYQLHGITMGPNEGNWLVKEMYLDENGNELSKDVFIAGPEAFKEVFSENFEAHGVKRDRLAIAELLGTDVNYIGDNWIIHEAAKAWTPENIVGNLSLGITALKPLLKRGVVFTADLRLTKAKSRAGHSYAGNKQLNEAMKSDPGLRKKMEKMLGNDVFNRTSTSNKGRRNPFNYEWDHSTTNRFELDLRSHANHLKKTANDIDRKGGFSIFYK